MFNFSIFIVGSEQWRGDVKFFRGDDLIGGYEAYLKITTDLPFG